MERALFSKTNVDSFSSFVNNPTFSDIKLQFHDDNKILFAHKLILSVKSKVFSKIFTGPLATTNDVIKIDMCTSDEFLEVLRFCYTGFIQFDQDNFIGIFTAANYYDISYLEQMCCDFGMSHLKVNNVCEIYDGTNKFPNKLKAKCLRMFDDSVSQIIHQDNFMNLSKASLQTLLVRDTLSINEFDLYEAVRKWVAYHPASKLDMVDIFKWIRFPIMTHSELARCCEMDDGILTTQSVADIKHYIETGDVTTALPYSTVKRQIYVDGALELTQNGEKNFYWNDQDYQCLMEFTVSKKTKITRFDFRPYENKLDNSIIYGIGLYVGDTVLFESTSYYSFINCNEPIVLDSNVEYTLIAAVSWKHYPNRTDNDLNSCCTFQMSKVPYIVCQSIAPFIFNQDEGEDITFISNISYKTLK